VNKNETTKMGKGGKRGRQKKREREMFKQASLCSNFEK
jgi:hypothetical protein